MSNYKMRAKVLSIGDTKSFGEGDFTKRELILEEDGEYKNLFAFEFIKDKTKLLDDILPDTYVTVHFNIRCRKVEKPGKDDMYFTSLSGWKVEV